MKKIRVGNKDLTLGKNLIEMKDSTELYNNQQYHLLFQRLKEEGFLLIRNIIPKTTIDIKARTKLLNHLLYKEAIQTERKRRTKCNHL